MAASLQREMEETMAETGYIAVERVEGKSTVTRCFCKYPLKLIVPKKAVPSAIDAVWIYSLSYGGGIVSGDRVSCGVSVGDDCTATLTTQASTKVYKSVGSKCSEQILETGLPVGAMRVEKDGVSCSTRAPITSLEKDINLYLLIRFCSKKGLVPASPKACRITKSLP